MVAQRDTEAGGDKHPDEQPPVQPPVYQSPVMVHEKGQTDDRG